MCSISGWILSRRGRYDGGDLVAMSRALTHRGPDDSGIHLDPGEGLALAHNRLSIIDLTAAGRQPMVNHATGDVLIYNGEIYNFQKLRRSLESKGYLFRSHSDAEVLLYSLAEWGMDCLKHIHGMFAFAFWSAQDRTLHLARDPMGIKPLYFWKLPSDEGIVFASEVKAFLRLSGFPSDINQRSLHQFLEFGYTFGESDTIFQHIQKLPPGHRLAIRAGEPAAVLRYFSPNVQPERTTGSRVLEEELYETLTQAVKEHLVADVPVGLLLSGGIDSSIITAIASRHTTIRTFSFGFDQSEVDERPHARSVSEHTGSQHEDILITPQELMADLKGVVRCFDDLFADWGTISTRLAYKKCRDRGIKVVIVGEGSDELFGGYDAFRYSLPDNSKAPLEWRLFRLYRAYAGRRYGSRYFDFRSRMREHLRLTNGDLFSAIRLFETRDQLPNNYVMKVDKASMAVSVEARVPFLDSRIAEIAYRVPGNMLIDHHTEKILLRSMAERYDLLPPQTTGRKKFGAGIAAAWMSTSESFRKFACEVILDRVGWTDALGLRKAMTEYFTHGRQGYGFPRSVSIFSNLAWRLLLLNLWSEHYQLSPVHD